MVLIGLKGEKVAPKKRLGCKVNGTAVRGENEISTNGKKIQAP